MRGKGGEEKGREEKIKRGEDLYRSYMRHERQVKAHFYEKEGETCELGSN